MTTITITLPRALLEQALEALEQYTAKELTVGQRYTNEGQRLLDTITDFRAALAQQTEPVPMPPFPPVSQWNRGCAVCGAHGNATGYVCPRSDCPTKVTCGGVA